MRDKKILWTSILILSYILLYGCGTPEERFEKQLNNAISEGFSYTTFYNEGFSAEYPIWPTAENISDDVELSVTLGYCSVTINTEKMTAQQWHKAITDAINQQNWTRFTSNDENFRTVHSMKYQNINLTAENRIYDCNGQAFVVTIMCIDQAVEDMHNLYDTVYGSVKCDKDEPSEKQEEITKMEEPAQTPAEHEFTYDTFVDGDFSVEYPEWDWLNDGEEQRILSVSRGVCSVIVDKHNALPSDITDWLIKSIKDNSEHELLKSSVKDDVYYLDYGLKYDEMDVTATTKVFYCNYQSYITQVVCVDELMTQQYENSRDSVIKSSVCAKQYEIPTPSIVEKKKKDIVEEEPEIIEEIEDSIVKTDAGEEFGIDEEMVVYFINGNVFFGKIMEDFPKGNLVIEDKDNDRELELRVNIDDNGKIILLEDGRYHDADVTLIIPLRDALNIFNNAQNINPLTLLGFAVNVKTDPPEIKNQVIQKVLRGEYS